MICPACDSELIEVKAGDIAVDYCKSGCGGVWFDEQELQKIDNGDEFNAVDLVNITSPSVSVDSDKIRKCPLCVDQVLVRQFYDVQNKVEVNQCWNCSGIFLDRGELLILRSQFATDSEHHAAVEAYADRAVSAGIEQVEIAGADRIEQIKKDYSNRGRAIKSALRDLLMGV